MVLDAFNTPPINCRGYDTPRFYSGTNETMVKPRKLTVLVATKERAIRNVVKETLGQAGNKLLFASSARQFLDLLMEEDVGLIIYDPRIPDLKALDAFRIGKTYHHNIPSILFCDKEDVDVITRILEKGLVYRTSRPLNKHYLRRVFDSVSKFHSDS